MLKKSSRCTITGILSILLTVLLLAMPITAYAEDTQSSDETVVTESAEESSEEDLTEETASLWPEEPELNSQAYCLMDYDTGNIICEKDMTQKMYPASITKIMTCLVAIENGNLDDTVTMTQTGVDYAISGSSNLATQVGEQFTLREMLYGLMLASANDIATQIGEHIGGGDLSTFIDMMNARAESIGCTGTHFNNACGMPDDDHYVTAYDMALIFQEALKNETFREVIGTKTYNMSATNMSGVRELYNHNAMLTDERFYYEGMLGGKNGYTDAAGYTLVTGVEQDGRTLLVVTLKATDVGSYCNDHKKLYDYGFAEFQNVRAMDEENVTSGGILTIPTDITVDDCTVADEADADDIVTRTWSYEGHEVGRAVLTEEYVEAEREKEAAALKAEQEAEEEAASSGSILSRRGNSGMSRSTFRNLLVALLILNIIGLVLIVIALQKRKKRRKK